MTDVEKGALLRLFIRNGYVLDFSTNAFDVFTMDSVGIPLCSKYGMSKGKSLTAFCSDGSDADVLKLLSDLFTHYEYVFLDTYDEESNRTLYEKCKKILDHAIRGIGIETPALLRVNREYIVKMSGRASNDIDNGDYDSAITKTRTLLEETFCYVLEMKSIVPITSGDIGSLYKQIRDTYNMHSDPNMDKRIKTLLSGLNSIVNAISEMRNKGSDAHGVGSGRVNISAYHARLFVNAAMAMADFILSVSENQT